jgi:hypothetical protein
MSEPASPTELSVQDEAAAIVDAIFAREDNRRGPFSRAELETMRERAMAAVTPGVQAQRQVQGLRSERERARERANELGRDKHELSRTKEMLQRRVDDYVDAERYHPIRMEWVAWGMTAISAIATRTNQPIHNLDIRPDRDGAVTIKCSIGSVPVVFRHEAGETDSRLILKKGQNTLEFNIKNTLQEQELDSIVELFSESRCARHVSSLLRTALDLASLLFSETNPRYDRDTDRALALVESAMQQRVKLRPKEVVSR